MSWVIVEWDWREQPDFDLIAKAMEDVYYEPTYRGPARPPTLVLVPDTGSDQYVLVVSTEPITAKEAQTIFDEAPLS
jgi:hypothetical protein